LGHTPFGHNGEYKLDKLMGEYGGFEHNLQSYRLVSFIEKKYPDFNGLNLTFETLEGLVKHSSKYDNPMNMSLVQFELDKNSTLEAQIIDIADEIAYNNHDIDDGLKSGFIDFDDLYKNVILWRDVVEQVKMFYSNIDRHVLIYRAVSFLISKLIDNVVENSKKLLKENSIVTLDEVRGFKNKLIKFSDEIEDKSKELKDYLYKNLYTHNKVIAMKIKAEKVIDTLFNAYISYPELLPKKFRMNVDEFGLHRVVADYIAGMTDRYALDEYEKIV
jgi:dGTPase